MRGHTLKALLERPGRTKPRPPTVSGTRTVFFFSFSTVSNSGSGGVEVVALLASALLSTSPSPLLSCFSRHMHVVLPQQTQFFEIIPAFGASIRDYCTTDHESDFHVLKHPQPC